MSYQNLKAELKRNGYTYATVSSFLGMSSNNLSMKMNGKVPFTVDEVKKIRNKFCPDASLDYLLDQSISSSPKTIS